MNILTKIFMIVVIIVGIIIISIVAFEIYMTNQMMAGMKGLTDQYAAPTPPAGSFNEARYALSTMSCAEAHEAHKKFPGLEGTTEYLSLKVLKCPSLP